MGKNGVRGRTWINEETFSCNQQHAVARRGHGFGRNIERSSQHAGALVHA